MLLLAACNGSDVDDSGGSGGETGTGEVGDANLPSNDGSILTRYFVESFDAFEETARHLIEQEERYLLQKQTWFFDDNGNGAFDSATETLRTTYPLQSSGVYYAHAAGLTGAGQIVAVTDDGALPGHEAFAGKSIDLASGLPVADHGTRVASVAAGNSANMIGVAPGADLAFGSYATFETRTTAARAAERIGAVVLNNSWGFVNTPVSQATFDSVFSSSASRDYLAALKSYAERSVVIFSMDNDSRNTQADLMPALPLLEPGLEAGWLAVINADADLVKDDVVAATRLSSGCLEAAAWCLAAEGSWVGASSETTTSYSFATGTSFAAPMVAGAMALLGEAFPDLTPHALRIRLLASADNVFSGFEADGEVELVNDFTHAISREWGHGFLDVKAALLPIGQTTATMADDSIYDISEPLMVAGTATGDAVTRSFEGVALAVHDALGARFALPAETLIAQQAPRPLSDDLMQDWQRGPEGGCCGVASYFSDTRLVAAGMGAGVVKLMLPGGGFGEKSFGAAIGRTFESGRGALSVSLGVGHDGGSLLPRSYSGGGSAILAGELSLSAPLAAGAEVMLAASLGGSLGGMGSGALLNSASAGFSAPDLFRRGDRFTVTLGLPVAVTRGTTSITLPVETRSGAIAQQSIGIDLAPDAREVRLGIEYSYAVSERSKIVFSAAYAENHGNFAGRRTAAAFAGYSARF
ncbi:MAG: S8 family peptidase [Pseudorhodobacter sp.]|nr:S8 family peptidase [Pseudorhodobacter sp.]